MVVGRGGSIQIWMTKGGQWFIREVFNRACTLLMFSFQSLSVIETEEKHFALFSFIL